MMKKMMILSAGILMVMGSMLQISAKEEEKKEEKSVNQDYEETEKEIILDVPYPHDFSGVIYGSLYEKIKDDNIDIDVNPPKPDNGGNQGGQGNNGGSGGNNNGSHGGVYEKERRQNGTYYDSALAQDGEALYKADHELMNIRIYKKAFELALEKQKSLVFSIFDKDGKMIYRLRYDIKDIKGVDESEIEEVEFDFEQECDHRSIVKDLLQEQSAVQLFLCKHDTLKIPVYIGIKVPDGWDRQFAIYEYEYNEKTKTLDKVSDELQIDHEQIVETKMQSMKDLIYANKSLVLDKLDLKTWVDGLSGNSELVDQGKAIMAVIFMMGALGAAGAIAYVYLKKKSVLLEKQKEAQGYEEWR